MYKRQNPDQTKIYLVDPGERVLRAMPEMLSKSARTTLESLGVEMVFKGRVQSMQPGEVMISTPNGDQCLQAATVIWTAGVRPSHLGRNLADSIGCELDKGGRIVVEPDFSVAGHPEIRVVGDLCSYRHTTNQPPYLAWPAQLRKQADLWAKPSLH